MRGAYALFCSPESLTGDDDACLLLPPVGSSSIHGTGAPEHKTHL